jgi:hypothetical protein
MHGAVTMANRDEFEAQYAARSGVTVAWLHAHGRYAEPCDCGADMCQGWAMGHQQEAGNALVITWDPPPSRPLFTDVTISVAEPSPDARICYTAT